MSETTDTKVLENVTAFIAEKRKKYDADVRRFLRLGSISLNRDISLQADQLRQVREYLNECTALFRDVEMLLSLSENMQRDVQFLLDEAVMQKMTDSEWMKANTTAKMAKEERRFAAEMQCRDLAEARKNIDNFVREVTALKRVVVAKADDLDHTRKDIVAMVWAIKTEQYIRTGVPTGANPQADDRAVNDYMKGR